MQPTNNRPAFNQPGFNQPALNQPAFNQPAFNQPMVPSNQLFNEVVVVNRANEGATVPNNASFSDVSTKVLCPQCHNTGMTVVTPHIGCTTVMWSICLVGLPGLICCCIDTCKDKTHQCPKCGVIVG
jgi:hypothetical protein